MPDADPLPPLRICLFSYQFLPRVGGLEQVAMTLATAWAADGHAVTLVTATPADAADYDRQFPFPVVRLPLGAAGRRAFAAVLPGVDVVVSNGVSLTYWDDVGAAAGPGRLHPPAVPGRRAVAVPGEHRRAAEAMGADGRPPPRAAAGGGERVHQRVRPRVGPRRQRHRDLQPGRPRLPAAGGRAAGGGPGLLRPHGRREGRRPPAAPRSPCATTAATGSRWTCTARGRTCRRSGRRPSGWAWASRCGGGAWPGARRWWRR